jgi:hypothetical protein
MGKSLYRKLIANFNEWLTKEPPPEEIPPYDYNRLKYEIRPGDVLLIAGRSRVSEIIRTITQSPWTHSALYIGRLHDIEDHSLKKTLVKHMERRENVRLVIEGIFGKGIVVTPLSHYRHNHIRICRPIGLSPADGQIVIANAIKALGRKYNVRQILDLARFLLPWSILPRRWGSSLFRLPSGEPDSGICSSLIAESFESVHFPILPFIKTDEEKLEMIPRNTYLFSTKDFDYSPYFEIIKYPLLSPDEQVPYYRRLPWSKEGIVHDDHGVISKREPENHEKGFFAKMFDTKSKSDKPDDKESP